LRESSVKRFVALSLVPVLLTALSASSAGAHRTRAFDACVTFRRHAPDERCYGNLEFAAGETVFLRAHVRPPHAHRRAVVLRKDPGIAGWTPIDRVDISERGRMRLGWRTESTDVAPTPGPYEFKFRIRGHGLSNEVYVFVS
jgi:hypothetical protein